MIHGIPHDGALETYCGKTVADLVTTLFPSPYGPELMTVYCDEAAPIATLSICPVCEESAPAADSQIEMPGMPSARREAH